MSWDEHEDKGGGRRAQAKSARYAELPETIDVVNMATLRIGDPGRYKMVTELISSIKADMIPEDAQLAVVEAMTPAVRRHVVSKVAGLEASVLMGFKEQQAQIETILRKFATASLDELSKVMVETGLSAKEAINLSMKLTTSMVRDLPRIYTLDRIQRLEESLMTILETMLTREQQDAVLEQVEKLELAAARKAQL